mgnify:CR=1 FL=1
MDNLKLAALDADDLKVLAAHAQDAVGKVGDIFVRQTGVPLVTIDA